MEESMGPFYGKFKSLSNVVLCQIRLKLNPVVLKKSKYNTFTDGQTPDNLMIRKKPTSAFKSGELIWWLLLNSLERKLLAIVEKSCFSRHLPKEMVDRFKKNVNDIFSHKCINVIVILTSAPITHPKRLKASHRVQCFLYRIHSSTSKSSYIKKQL